MQLQKVKEFAKFIAYNSFFGTVFFLGVVKEIDGFLNLTRFITWFAFLLLVLIYAVIEDGGGRNGEKSLKRVLKSHATQRQREDFFPSCTP